MDHCEETILELLKKKSLASKKEVYSSLKTFPADDIKEAIVSLQKQGYLVVVSPMGEESYSITKTGLSKLE